MGNNSSRIQPPGPNYAQNLLFQPDYQDASKRAQAAGYPYNYPVAYPQAQPIYSNGYVLQYPMGYQQAMYQQPQAVQYYVQPQQMTMQQPQMAPQGPQQQFAMQPQYQMPQAQMQAQPQPQPQQQEQMVFPPGFQPQQPQMQPASQSTPSPGPGIPEAQYPAGYAPGPPPPPPQMHENPDPRFPSPLPPAHPDAFGPPGPRPLTPISNPLPSPPKDIYELEPYKSMLSRDLTGTWTPPPRAPGELDSSPSGDDGGGGRRRRRRNFFGSFTGRREGGGDGEGGPGRRRGGLFRSWTTRRREDERDERSPSPPAVVMNGPITPVIPGEPSPMRMPTPVLPQTGSPSTLEPVRFNMMTGHDGFLPHSPHRVLYQGELYPSAFHLFEALKFLRNERHDIAARIREMENPADVHPLSERMKEYAKEGFERELMEYMDEALYLKFTQHPDLRDQLLNTGVADLIYAEATDPVWGEGTLGQGMNHLGIALRRLRERLRAELAGQ